MKSAKGYFLILGGTLFWGMSAVIAKMLFNRQIEPLILVQMRVTLSALVMVVWAFSLSREVLWIRRADLFRFVLMGVVGIAGSNFTYYFAIQQTSVSTAILIQYTAPILVLAYAAVSKEESLTVVKITAGVFSILGVFLAVAGNEFSFGHVGGLGFLSGVGAAVCWAFANVYLRRLLRTYSVWTVLVYSFLAASVFWLFFNPPWRVFSEQYPIEVWLQFFGFAMISVLIPHSLYFTGVKYLTASRAIITGTFEPIIAIVGSFVVLGDVLRPVQIVGALIVIIAIAVLQLKREETEILPRRSGAEVK